MANFLVILNHANCEVYAHDVYSLLKGKTFNISSTTLRTPKDVVEPHGLMGRTLKGGLLVENGVVSIPLLPSRTIAWDLNSELVKILFRDNGEIVITRIFGSNEKCITRHILPYLNPT